MNIESETKSRKPLSKSNVRLPTKEPITDKKISQSDYIIDLPTTICIYKIPCNTLVKSNLIKLYSKELYRPDEISLDVKLS